MIITDDTPESPLKSQAALNNLTSPHSAPAPPPYPQGPESSSSPRQPLYSGVSPPMLPPPVLPINRQSPSTRFCKAFAFALLIYFLAAMIVRSFVELIVWSHQRHRIDWGRVGYPQPSHGNLGDCVVKSAWSSHSVSTLVDLAPGSFPYYRRTSFELPTSSDTLYLLSRGSLSSGSVEIVDSLISGDTVKVDIVVRYYDQQAVDRSGVCLLQKEGEASRGIGFFTPDSDRRWTMLDRLYYDITVTLPAGAPLEISNFITDLPNFSHKIGDLDGRVNFQTLVLKGSNHMVDVGSVSAGNISIATSNGAIEGSFKTSTSLSLVTSNAPINVDVSLLNTNPSRYTELLMKTSNGAVSADINLVSSKPSGGSYKVTTQSSNSPLTINYLKQPVNSILHFEGRTSNSPVDVALHPAYEGTFSLTTSVFTPSMDQREVKDPSGQGRRRVIRNTEVRKNKLEGSVRWGGSNRDKGTGLINVRTSNALAHLQL